MISSYDLTNKFCLELGKYFGSWLNISGVQLQDVTIDGPQAGGHNLKCCLKEVLEKGGTNRTRAYEFSK